MIANLGFGSLVIAFFLTLYCIVVVIWGGWKHIPEFLESSRLGIRLLLPLVSLSTGCLLFLLVNKHYEVQYVYNVISEDLPEYLRFTALWGGQAGSLLFWSWLVALVASWLANELWAGEIDFYPWVMAVLSVTLAFFLSLSIFFENPFVRFWELPDGSRLTAMLQPAGTVLSYPANGYGLNPLLRHPGMVLHPPLLYMGFVALVVPYAYGITALITNHIDDRWIKLTRRWSLMAWLFLSMGLIMGSRWAYDVLGWGGYWSWDPVEIAALMPWLTGTAYIHSVMTQERMGMFKRWNMVLIILTYCLVIFGTFLTRSGVLSSVHAFSQSSIGPIFLVFIALTFAVSLGLLLWRWGDLQEQGVMRSFFSRESLFLFNNLLFIGIFFVCLWGLMYPVVYELFTGQKVTIGPPFYEKATAPLFLALLLLMGLAPLSAWGHSTWKTMRKNLLKPLVVSLVILVIIILAGVRFPLALIGFGLVILVVCVNLFDFGRVVNLRNRKTNEAVLVSIWKVIVHHRRRYGGHLVHLGVVMIALGIMGIEMFQTETQGTIARGQTIKLDDYTFSFRDLAIFDSSDGRNIARAVIGVNRGTDPVSELYPRRDYYYASQQPVTVPGIHSTLEEDVYVILVDWQPISYQGATFKIYRNPLVGWMWAGAWVFILGTLMAGWPTLISEDVRSFRSSGRFSHEDTI